MRDDSNRIPWAKPLWVLSSMVLVAVVPWFSCPRLQMWTARAEAARALGELRHCLIGSRDGRSVAELRIATITASLGPSRNGDWPARCGSHAIAMLVALETMDASHRSRCLGVDCRAADPDCSTLARLRQALVRLRGALADGEIPTEQAGQVLSLSEQLHIAAAEPGLAQTPPPRVVLHSPDTMTPLFRSTPTMLTDPPTDPSIRLLFHDPDRPFGLCRIALASGSAAWCRELPRNIPSSLGGQLLAAEPGAPERLLGSTSDLSGGPEPFAVYDPASGERLLRVSAAPAGGFVWRDGTVAILIRGLTDRTTTLRRVRDGVAEPPAHVAVPAAATAGPQLLADEIAWTVATEQGDHRLFVRRALPGDEPLGPAVAVGSIGPLRGPPALDSCRTGDTLAVVVQGDPEGYQTSVALALRVADRWHAPRAARVDSDWFGLTCREREATLSWIEPTGERRVSGPTVAASAVRGTFRVRRIRCTPDGCRDEQTEIELERFARSSRYLVGDLGETTVVLWQSAQGDVRMLRAPLASLADAMAMPLFDDAAHGGFAWELGRGAAFVRGGIALLLIKAPAAGTDLAVYGLRIPGAAAIAPTPISLTGQGLR